ncbi:sucrase ferredoxin [Streptomyces sp. NPDC060194]|uniref:sucrase ferredoxin n=1 Tax=Streptomyces sp. NPDC060194 TaxID=3347069 RepID=UPI0036671A6A
MSTCATASWNLAEPLAGTAATATTWLLVEQPGPWGPKALTASRLDPELGRALESAAEGTGVRVALVRRPGPHADDRAQTAPAPRQVYAAHTVPGRSWVRSARVGDPAALRRLDLAALGAGDPASFDHALGGEAHTGPPLALVCTNGKRDRCCAVLGRPLAAELAASGEEGVWEVTHLGGHRFSPTLLVLPHGYAYGRADAPSVKDVLRAVETGRVVTDGCRGRSAWERPAQAAELAVRRATGEDRAEALTVATVRTAAPVADDPGPRWEVTVAHTDGGRSWQVVVAQRASLPERPESCGAALGAPARMDVVGVTAAPR